MTSIAEALRISFLDLDPVFYAVNYADQDVLQFVKDVQFKRAVIYWREKKHDQNVLALPTPTLIEEMPSLYISKCYAKKRTN